jgi:transposase
VYLPAYSPDYNPIEEAFAKIKNLLRKETRCTAHFHEDVLEEIQVSLGRKKLAIFHAETQKG